MLPSQRAQSLNALFPHVLLPLSVLHCYSKLSTIIQASLIQLFIQYKYVVLYEAEL